RASAGFMIMVNKDDGNERGGGDGRRRRSGGKGGGLGKWDGRWEGGIIRWGCGDVGWDGGVGEVVDVVGVEMGRTRRKAVGLAVGGG
ncbi:hypothetical protein, partial [Kocuria rosea]|uniref:hypothetical protein n=1 Tax=Kocuria rosea TaxID=1275 RepID=UPI001C93140B